MKILLTGDKGFIGSHLKRYLQKEGYQVIGCDIKNGFQEDIREPIIEEKFIKNKPDIVIHLAALAGVRNSVKIPHLYFDVNVWGTYNLLTLSSKYHVEKFLFASSSSVYGEQRNPLKEEMICKKPLSPYAMTKLIGEYLCKFFDRLPTLVFRPFTVYGENGRKDMVVYKLINAGLTGKTFYRFGDGESTRGYTNVHDLCEGIIKLLKYQPKDNFEVFNLGGQERIKLNDLISIVKEEFPNLKVEEKKRNPVDVLHSFADITRAKNKLGFLPKRNFKEEIKKLCFLAKLQMKK